MQTYSVKAETIIPLTLTTPTKSKTNLDQKQIDTMMKMLAGLDGKTPASVLSKSKARSLQLSKDVTIRQE